MSIVALGLGYAARALFRRMALFPCVGTTRSRARASALEAQGFKTVVFDGHQASEDVRGCVTRAKTLIVSTPPDAAGDPALRVLSSEIERAHELGAIVYLSTIGVYGDHGGAWIDEAAELKTRTVRGRERIVAESAWRELAQRRAVSLYVLRLAGIYGPGRSLLEKLRGGKARRIVKPGQVFNRIHVEDLAAIAEALIESRRPSGVWNVADDEPAPPDEVIAFAAGLIGIAPPQEERFEDAELSAMARSFYEDNKRVSNAKIKRELKRSLIYPTYREGLRALAKEDLRERRAER